MADPLIYVDAPHREPRRGGIKSVTGEFQHLDRLGAAANVQYTAAGCVWPAVAPGLCWGTVTEGDKDFTGLATELGIASIFGQYFGVECYLGAGNDVEYADRARSHLANTEAHEVEAVLAGWAAGGVATGGATLGSAVAGLDQYADQNYPGAPVMLLNRGTAVAARAAGVIRGGDQAGSLWTANGSPVVASWVVPAGKAYAIGWPTVYASDIGVVGARNLTQNKEMAIAERLYALTVDCQFRAVATFTAPTDDEVT